MKRVNFPSGPKIGKCGFSEGFLVKTWKDICYPIGKLTGKVEIVAFHGIKSMTGPVPLIVMV